MITIYDGVAPIEERFMSGVYDDEIKRRYYYEDGINKLALVECFFGLSSPVFTFVPLTDDRGTVVGVIYTANETVVEKLYYNSTGLCKSFDGSGTPITDPTTGFNVGRSVLIPFGWCGMYRDEFTGKYHTHFHEYDPIHGRWLSENPAGYKDSMSLYAAMMGVNDTDKLGLGIEDDLGPGELNLILTDPSYEKYLEDVPNDKYLSSLTDFLKFREGRMALALYLQESRAMQNFSPQAPYIHSALESSKKMGGKYLLTHAVTAGEVRKMFDTRRRIEFAKQRWYELKVDFLNQIMTEALTAGALKGAGLLTKVICARSLVFGAKTIKYPAIKPGGTVTLWGTKTPPWGTITPTKGSSLARRGTPWKYGYTGGARGGTDMFGNITIRRGLTGNELTETIRHESVHRFLSPKKPGPINTLRAKIRMLSGVYQYTPAGEKFKQFIERKCWVEFG